jgi:hypothetical protein
VCEAGEVCDWCPDDCGACGGCTVDTDCVPDALCHPGGCVPASQGPTGGGACDAGCQPYTLDCLQGYCGCIDGRCAAVITDPL